LKKTCCIFDTATLLQINNNEHEPKNQPLPTKKFDSFVSINSGCCKKKELDWKNRDNFKRLVDRMAQGTHEPGSSFIKSRELIQDAWPLLP